MKIWPFNNRGLINTESGREGIIIINLRSEDHYEIVSTMKYTYNVILEVKEVYNDVTMSKVEIVNIPYDRSQYYITRIFNPWVESSSVKWLQPDKVIDRDNKIQNILK